MQRYNTPLLLLLHLQSMDRLHQLHTDYNSNNSAHQIHDLPRSKVSDASRLMGSLMSQWGQTCTQTPPHPNLTPSKNKKTRYMYVTQHVKKWTDPCVATSPKPFFFHDIVEIQTELDPKLLNFPALPRHNVHNKIFPLYRHTFALRKADSKHS